MKKNTITSILIIFLFLGGIIWWSKSSDQKPNTEVGSLSSLTVSEKVYDFGEISMKDGLVDHLFEVTNETDKDIVIKKVATSCMCTNAYIESINGKKGPFGMEGMGYIPPANEIVKAGDSLNIRVVYDPNAHGPAGVGIVDRFITLSDANNNSLELEIKAIVKP